jgi:hypothetical protein
MARQAAAEQTLANMGAFMTQPTTNSNPLFCG